MVCEQNGGRAACSADMNEGTEKQWRWDIPDALERANAGDDADLVLEAGAAGGVVEVRTDGVEPGEGPLAEVVVGGHGCGR